MGKELRVHVQMWNAETNGFEWRDYAATDVQWLCEHDVVDYDAIGAALKTEAYNQAAKACDEKFGAYGFDELLTEYIRITNEDIYIK